MSQMTRKHITLWLGCIVCESCSQASMTLKLHKEVDHKNSESITNFTFFFNRWNQFIGEKMVPTLWSPSSRRFLHPIRPPPPFHIAHWTAQHPVGKDDISVMWFPKEHPNQSSLRSRRNSHRQTRYQPTLCGLACQIRSLQVQVAFGLSVLLSVVIPHLHPFPLM